MPLLSFSQEIKWAKSYKGRGGDQTYGNCIWQSVFDSQGNLYVCGTVGWQGKMGDVVLIPASSSGRNSFFAKFDSNGQLLWSKSLSVNTPNASDYGHIRMQLVNDTVLYIKSQVYPPQDGFTSLCWFLDTLITYPVQDSIPFFPKTMCPHEAFLKLNQDGELLDAHYIYNWVDYHWSKDGVEHVSTYRKTFEEDTQFYVDKDGNYYIYVVALNVADTNVLNFVVDDKDTIKYAINSDRDYTDLFLKFDSNFNFVWSKDVFLNDTDACGKFYYTNLSFDEEDNMYLSGTFASSEYKWLDLGNNQRIKRSYPGYTGTGFIIKYDTSRTPQWVNQMFVQTDSKTLALESNFRQSVIKGDTIFVQYRLVGIPDFLLEEGAWYYFDSLYTYPIDTLNMVEGCWEHSGFVAYDKNTGQYLSHGLIKGRSEVLSNVAVSNGQVYGQVSHNNSWDIGGLDTIITSQTNSALSLFKWNAADGEILEVIDNYADGGSYEARHMSQNNYEPTEIFVSGETHSDTMDLHDTIVVTSLPDYGGLVYMFVLKDSSVLNHYNVIRDTICDSADWNGYHITWKGEYRDTLQAADGYDSIILYRVQVRHSFKDEQTIEINDGETYDFHGQMLYEAGTYYDSLQTINGCDSIYILNLKVKSGLNDIDSYVNIESVNVAPNPAKDEAVITYTIKDNGTATFVLYNSEGQELISKQLVGKGKQQISLTNYPVGTYFYKVFTSEKVIKSDKLVIAR